MSHTIKIWEKVEEKRLREETEESEDQFGLLLEKSTIEPILFVRQLIDKCREKRRSLAMVFIYLEKAYDRISKRYYGGVLKKKRVPTVHLKIFQICMIKLQQVRSSGF